MVDIQSPTAEIRRGKTEEERKPQGKNIMACRIPQGGYKYWLGCVFVGERRSVFDRDLSQTVRSRHDV